MLTNNPIIKDASLVNSINQKGKKCFKDLKDLWKQHMKMFIQGIEVNSLLN